MGKASSRKRVTHHDSATGRFEPAGPMNDLAIRNHVKTTVAAAQHLIAFYQVAIDHGDFQEAKGASAVSFVLSVLVDNLQGQLTLRRRLPEEDLQAIAQVARAYPKLFTVDGVQISALGRQ